MSGACLSTLCAWEVIDFHDTTEKNRLPSSSKPGCVLELDWGNQSAVIFFLCLSDFKTPFSDVMSVPLMEEHHLSPSFSSQLVYQFWSLFINFWLRSIWSGNSLLPPVPWLTVPSDHDQTGERALPALQPWLALFHSRTAHFLSVCSGNRKEMIKKYYFLLQLGMQPYFFSIQIRATISSGKVT